MVLEATFFSVRATWTKETDGLECILAREFDFGCLGSVLLIVMYLLEGPSRVPSGPTMFSNMHRCAFFFCAEIYQLRAGSVFWTFLCVRGKSFQLWQHRTTLLWPQDSALQEADPVCPPSPSPSLGASLVVFTTVLAEAYGC